MEDGTTILSGAVTVHVLTINVQSLRFCFKSVPLRSLVTSTLTLIAEVNAPLSSVTKSLLKNRVRLIWDVES